VTDSDASSSSDEAPARSVGRRVVRGTGFAVAAVLGLLLGALLLLQTEWGATRVAQWAVDRFNPVEGTTLTVERASGSWLGGLTLYDVAWTLDDAPPNEGAAAPPPADADDGPAFRMAETRAERLAAIDTLDVGYRLPALLGGTLHLTRVHLGGPEVYATQTSDSTWNWMQALEPWLNAEPDSDADTASTPLHIQLDQARVSRGYAEIAFWGAETDSTAYIDPLTLSMHDVQVGETVHAALDTLSIRGELPDESATPLTLAAGGTLTSEALSLRSMQLDAPGSRLRGQGQLQFATNPLTVPGDTLTTAPDAALTETAFSLRADSLAIADLVPFMPGLAPAEDEVHRFSLDVTQQDERWQMQGNGSVNNGGTWQGTAAARLPGRDSLRYEADLAITQYRTQLMGTPTRVNATLQADLAGATHETLDGTAGLTVRDTRVADIAIESIGVTATATDGAVSWESQGRINDGALQSSGTITPFAEAPAYALTARADDLALQRWLPDGGLTSDLNADLEIDGSGFAPETRSVSAQLTLRPSTVNSFAIDALALEADLTGADAEAEAELTVPGGRIAAAGRGTLDGSETFGLERLETTDFDLNTFLDDDALPPTRITATAQAEGQGFAPNTMQLEGTAQLNGTTYGQVQVDTLATTWRMSDGALEANLDAVTNAGAARLEATARPFDTPLRVELAEGRLDRVDIGPILQDTTQTSTLNGTFSGAWTQPETGPYTARTAFELTDSELNEQSIESLQANVDLDTEERLTFDMRLRVPGGSTALAGTARPFAERPSLSLTNGRIEALNIGALLGEPTLDTDLNGSLALNGAGQTLDDLALDGRLDLADSRINKAHLPEAAWTINADAGQLQSALDARFDLGTLIADLDANLPDSTYTLAVQADQFDGAALTGQDTLDADLSELRATLDGRGWTPETAEFTTTLDAVSAVYGPFELDAATLRAAYAGGRLSIDSLQVESNVLTATGTGAAALLDTDTPSDITISADVHSLAPVQEWAAFRVLAADSLYLTGRLQGTADQLRFNGQVDGENLIIDDTRIGTTELVVAGGLDADYALDRLEARTTSNNLNAAGLIMWQVQARGTYRAAQGLTATTTVEIDSDRRARLDLSTPPLGDTYQATIERFDLNLDTHAWSLEQPAEIVQDGTAFEIGGLMLTSATGQLAADGRIDTAGPQNLGVTLENIAIDPFAKLMELDGLGGRVNGALSMTGSADAPLAEGRLRTRVQSEGIDVGTLDSEISYDDLELDINAHLTHADGSTLTLAGGFPIDLRLDATNPPETDVMEAPVDLRMSADAFDISWIDPFLDPALMQDLIGRMNADVRIAGTRTNPDVQGEAMLSGLSVVLTDLESRFREGRAQLRLQGTRITIVESEIRSAGRGRMAATGTVDLEDLTLGTIDLDVQADNFQAVNTRAYRRGTINGDMSVQGTTERPRLTGAIQVVRADISYDELEAGSAADVETVALNETDRADLERRFGLTLSDADTTAYDAYQAMAIDMEVQIQRETWLRSRSALGLNIQFNGDLDLQKAHDEDLELYGSIDIVPDRSTVEQFGQVFRVEEGVLTFNGPVDDPQMSFAAVYEQRARETRDTEVSITLNAEGRLGDLNLSFGSEPPMSTSNILSYLATGRPADNLLGGGNEEGGGSGELATQLAIGQASNFVENLAASQLGLDVVRLQVRPNGISYLTVGRYLTPRFYVSVEQPIDTGSNQTEVLEPDLLLEYELTRTVMMRVLRRESSLRFNLLYERAY